MVVHCRDELAPKQLIQRFLPNGYRSTSASTNLFTQSLMFFMCRVNDTTHTPKLSHYLGTSERDVLPLEKKRPENSWNYKEMTALVVQIVKLEVDGRLSFFFVRANVDCVLFNRFLLSSPLFSSSPVSPSFLINVLSLIHI